MLRAIATFSKHTSSFPPVDLPHSAPDWLQPSLAHWGMHRRHTPGAPPASHFPFRPCQQCTGVHLPTQTIFLSEAPASTTRKGFWRRGVVVVGAVWCCHRYCWLWWWWRGCGWLDEILGEQCCSHVTGAHQSPCDLSRVQPVPWLQSPGARSGQGWRGGRAAARGRLDGKCTEGGVGERRQGGAEALSCRDKLLLAARRCTRRLHVSVTWPCTLQETPAAITWRRTRTKTEHTHASTHTHHGGVVYMCTQMLVFRTPYSSLFMCGGSFLPNRPHSPHDVLPPGRKTFSLFQHSIRIRIKPSGNINIFCITSFSQTPQQVQNICWPNFKY